MLCAHVVNVESLLPRQAEDSGAWEVVDDTDLPKSLNSTAGQGVIVFTTVYGNVVVGPTAVDQPDKSDRSVRHD
jgi:hypothetical protein